MSNDTPYLLRMEMIKLAQQRASERYQAEWGAAAHNASLNENATLLTEVPEYPTTEQILAEAKKIKEFVDTGK